MKSINSLRLLPNEVTLAAQSGELLSDVLNRAGVALRYDCGGRGTCQQCRVRYLGREVLACQTRVEQSGEVEILGASRVKTITRIVTEDFSEINSAPNAHEKIVAALDLGTTTLALRLLLPPKKRLSQSLPQSLVAVRANPQIRYGDDIMSRIRFASESPQNAAVLQECVLAATRDMLKELCVRCDVSWGKISLRDIEKLAVAGNTVMQQLFLGIDTASLGFAPFRPPQMRYEIISAQELNLQLNKNATVETMPILGGFVGGDITGGVLSALRFCEPPSLLLDLGTNGEMVLLTKENNFLAAATAAGPAFEGARIRCGVVATSGAIERVWFENFEKLKNNVTHFETIDDAPPCGLCGSGVIDAIATLYAAENLDARGRMQTRGAIPLIKILDGTSGNPHESLAWEIVSARESATGEAILLTQRDVREFQLANGAIRAGIEILLRTANVDIQELKTFCLAGGFGQHIPLASARHLGLIPQFFSDDKIKICGNSSLAGATLLACDSNVQNAALEIQEKTTHLDLAAHSAFADIFAAAMSFPV